MDDWILLDREHGMESPAGPVSNGDLRITDRIDAPLLAYDHYQDEGLGLFHYFDSLLPLSAPLNLSPDMAERGSSKVFSLSSAPPLPGVGPDPMTYVYSLRDARDGGNKTHDQRESETIKAAKDALVSLSPVLQSDKKENGVQKEAEWGMPAAPNSPAQEISEDLKAQRELDDEFKASTAVFTQLHGTDLVRMSVTSSSSPAHFPHGLPLSITALEETGAPLHLCVEEGLNLLSYYSEMLRVTPETKQRGGQDGSLESKSRSTPLEMKETGRAAIEVIGGPETTAKALTELPASPKEMVHGIDRSKRFGKRESEEEESGQTVVEQGYGPKEAEERKEETASEVFASTTSTPIRERQEKEPEFSLPHDSENTLEQVEATEERRSRHPATISGQEEGPSLYPAPTNLYYYQILPPSSLPRPTSHLPLFIRSARALPLTAPGKDDVLQEEGLLAVSFYVLLHSQAPSEPAPPEELTKIEKSSAAISEQRQIRNVVQRPERSARNTDDEQVMIIEGVKEEKPRAEDTLPDWKALGEKQLVTNLSKKWNAILEEQTSSASSVLPKSATCPGPLAPSPEPQRVQTDDSSGVDEKDTLPENGGSSKGELGGRTEEERNSCDAVSTKGLAELEEINRRAVVAEEAASNVIMPPETTAESERPPEMQEPQKEEEGGPLLGEEPGVGQDAEELTPVYAQVQEHSSTKSVEEGLSSDQVKTEEEVSTNLKATTEKAAEEEDRTHRVEEEEISLIVSEVIEDASGAIVSKQSVEETLSLDQEQTTEEEVADLTATTQEAAEDEELALLAEEEEISLIVNEFIDDASEAIATEQSILSLRPVSPGQNVVDEGREMEGEVEPTDDYSEMATIGSVDRSFDLSIEGEEQPANGETGFFQSASTDESKEHQEADRREEDALNREEVCGLEDRDEVVEESSSAVGRKEDDRGLADRPEEVDVSPLTEEEEVRRAVSSPVVGEKGPSLASPQGSYGATVAEFGQFSGLKMEANIMEQIVSEAQEEVEGLEEESEETEGKAEKQEVHGPSYTLGCKDGNLTVTMAEYAAILAYLPRYEEVETVRMRSVLPSLLTYLREEPEHIIERLVAPSPAQEMGLTDSTRGRGEKGSKASRNRRVNESEAVHGSKGLKRRQESGRKEGQSNPSKSVKAPGSRRSRRGSSSHRRAVPAA